MAVSPIWLWPIAASMAYIIALLVRWASTARTRLSAAIVLFLLGMMGAMFLGAAIYESRPSTSSLVVGLWVAAGLMAVSVFPLFGLFLAELRGRLTAPGAFQPPVLRGVPAFAFGVAFLVLAGEVVMGRSLELAAGTGASGAEGALGVAATTLSSQWFLFPMGAEMALTVVLVGGRVPRVLRAALLLQAASMVAAPPAISDPRWVVGSSIAAGAVMVLLLGFLMRELFLGGRIGRAVLRYCSLLLVVELLMAAGIVLWATTGTLVVFAGAAVAQMLLFFDAIVVPELFGSGRPAPEPAPGPPPGPRPASGG